MSINLPSRRTFDPVIQEAWRAGSEVVGRADRFWRHVGLLLCVFPCFILYIEATSKTQQDPVMLSPFGLGFSFLILCLLTWCSEVRIDESARVIRVRHGLLGLSRHHLYVFDQVEGVSMDSISSRRYPDPLNRVWLTIGGKRVMVLITYHCDLAGDFYQYLRHDLGFEEGDGVDLSTALKFVPWALFGFGVVLLLVGWAMTEAQLRHRGPLEASMGESLRHMSVVTSRSGETDGDRLRIPLLAVGGILALIGIAATLRNPDSDD